MKRKRQAFGAAVVRHDKERPFKLLWLVAVLLWMSSCGTYMSLSFLEGLKAEARSFRQEKIDFINPTCDKTEPLKPKLNNPAGVDVPTNTSDTSREDIVQLLQQWSELERAQLADFIAEVEAATVHVDAPRAFGAGIAIGKNGASYDILTTYAMVTNGFVRRENQAVKVVWFSGTARQKTYFGRVIAKSKVGQLALVQVKCDDSELPWLNFTSTNQWVDLNDSSSLIGFRFDYGEGLGIGKSPTLAHLYCQVESLEYDEDCHLRSLSLGTQFYPAGQGGPILDLNGRIIGILAWDGKRNLVVPIPTIDKFLEGTVEFWADGARQIREAGEVSITFGAEVIDPFSQIEAWGFLRKYGVPVEAGFEEPYLPIQGRMESFLPGDGVEITFHLQKGHELESVLTYQIWIKRKSSDGLVFLKPGTIDLNR